MSRRCGLILLFLSVPGCRASDPSESERARDELPPTPAEFSEGQEVYESGCASCHDSSRDGAPRLGFLAAWERRLEQGEEALVQNAINGKGMMPPKGDMPDLTEAQISAAVRYMTYRAGLNIPAKH